MTSERDATWFYLGWSLAFIQTATDVARLFHPARLSDDRAQLDIQVALLQAMARTASTQRPPPHADQIETARQRLLDTMTAVAQARASDPELVTRLAEMQDVLDAALASVEDLHSRLSGESGV